MAEEPQNIFFNLSTQEVQGPWGHIPEYTDKMCRIHTEVPRKNQAKPPDVLMGVERGRNSAHNEP
jgi:hypothetical protein